VNLSSEVQGSNAGTSLRRAKAGLLGVRLLYLYDSTEEVHSSPAKRRDLSDAKPGECRDNYNSAAWLGQSLDKSKRIKRVLAWQLSRAMQEQQKTKQAMAKQLRTSRSQLDRLLDPQNVSVTLDTITRAARALGKRLIIRVADVKAQRGAAWRGAPTSASKR